MVHALQERARIDRVNEGLGAPGGNTHQQERAVQVLLREIEFMEVRIVSWVYLEVGGLRKPNRVLFGICNTLRMAEECGQG